MNLDPNITRLITEQARLLRTAEHGVRCAPSYRRAATLDEYLLTEERAVRLVSIAFSGVAFEPEGGFDPFHPLNISALSADSPAVRLVASAALNHFRAYLEAAIRIDEENK